MTVTREKEESSVLSAAVEITVAKEDSVVKYNVTNVLDAKSDSQKATVEVIME